MGDRERLPILDGARVNDYENIVRSVFYKPRKADRGMLNYYRRCFQSRRSCSRGRGRSSQVRQLNACPGSRLTIGPRPQSGTSASVVCTHRATSLGSVRIRPFHCLRQRGQIVER